MQTTSTTRTERFSAVTAALNRNETALAIMLAEQALAEGEEQPLYLNLSAFRLEQDGDFAGALAHLRRALEIEPRDVLVLTAVGRTLSMLGRDEEALDYFQAALSLHPRHAPAHHGLGLSLAATGQDVEARRAQMAAADLDPNFPDPLGSLADHAIRDEKYDVARTLAQRAVALDPGQPAAVLALAALDARDGLHAQALQRAEGLLATPLTPLHRAAAEQTFGEQLEALGRPEEAFGAFGRANGLLREVYRPIYDRDGVETSVPMTRRLRTWFAKERSEDWGAACGSEPSPAKKHVFLVGFVRSGTTLLEQVLASHPDVVALEEKATLRAIAGPLFADAASLERARSLGPEEADALRRAYWASVREFGVEPSGKVFVDKAPLSTLWLPLVAKLFPEARVLFAVRDPRDVVLSAFKHRFLVNAMAWPFTDLVEAAEFYDGVMALGERYRSLLPTAVHQHRHEDLIADFDGEVGRICDFIGIDWTESMRDFAETARRRDVRTPSRDQVRAGLNASGVGRWRSYGPSVEPIMSILQPWVERHGYEAGQA